MSKKIGRNDPCPCGSGKKYKKCCLDMGSRNPNAKIVKKLKEKIKENEREIKENEERIKRYNETIKETEKRMEEIKEQIEKNQDIFNKKSKEMGNNEIPKTSVNDNTSTNELSVNMGWSEGKRDEIIRQLKDLIYKDNEYPHICQKSDDYIEVLSICKHGVCRVGYVASPVDFDDVEGLWDSDESWDGDECIICDAGICPECNVKHDLACPQCHKKIEIALTEDEAIEAYKNDRDIFLELKCEKCGADILTRMDISNESK